MRTKNRGRPVPHHGSGWMQIERPSKTVIHADDPDETEGRKLYRALADKIAIKDLSRRPVRLKRENPAKEKS